MMPVIVLAAWSILLATMLGGCIPVAAGPGWTSASRDNVAAGIPGFIAVGTTTRADVLLAVGEPDGEAPDGRWFSYASVFTTGGGGFILLAGAGGGAVTARMRYRHLVVRFDDRGVVASSDYEVVTCWEGAGGLGQAYTESRPCIDTATGDLRSQKRSGQGR